MNKIFAYYKQLADMGNVHGIFQVGILWDVLNLLFIRFFCRITNSCSRKCHSNYTSYE